MNFPIQLIQLQFPPRHLPSLTGCHFALVSPGPGVLKSHWHAHRTHCIHDWSLSRLLQGGRDLDRGLLGAIVDMPSHKPSAPVIQFLLF